MSSKKDVSRRDFLKVSSVAAAGATLVSSSSITRSAYAAGDDVIKVAITP